MIEVGSLTVRFSGITPIDDMSLTFPGGTCGLIGPNGAGKTTFFNVLSGFVKPADGSVSAFGENLLKMPDYRRARWGLRRTFQTEMAIDVVAHQTNIVAAQKSVVGAWEDPAGNVHLERARLAQ